MHYWKYLISHPLYYTKKNQLLLESNNIFIDKKYNAGNENNYKLFLTYCYVIYSNKYSDKRQRVFYRL